MFSIVGSLLSFILLAPEISLNWADPKLDSVEITVVSDLDDARSCISSGLEVRYRYEITLCATRNLWFNDCTAKYQVFKTVQYDAITQSYKYVHDLIGDAVEPESTTYAEMEKALRALTKVPALKLDTVAPAAYSYLKSGHPAIGIRVSSDCKGEYNSMLVGLSRFLTFGLIRIQGFDTGWKHFDLTRSSP